MQLTKLFTSFFESERSGGLVLIVCTAISLLVANSSLGAEYSHLWHIELVNKTVEFWINDGLMTIFFLLVGLEIEREIYIGELAGFKKALLPVIGAVGGMIVPALIHFGFNNGTATERGFGIPMATDIAFSLGILSLLGKRVPGSLKVFLTALAIIDDLGAIIVIAFFYSDSVGLFYLGGALLLFAIMLLFNYLRVYRISIYLLLGCLMWFMLYRSGLHPSITGVLVAFTIPFGNGEEKSPSYSLQKGLHKIVAFVILPLFALVNTVILIPASFAADFTSLNSLGILIGLIAGKPLGIFLFCFAAIKLRFCALPEDIYKRDLFGAGVLAGIGFTMSIFITLLAYTDADIINSSKIAVIGGSITAGVIGYLWLNLSLKRRIH